MADNEKGKAELSRLLNEPSDILRSALETIAAVNPEAAQAANFVMQGGKAIWMVTLTPQTLDWLSKKGRMVEARSENGILRIAIVKTR